MLDSHRWQACASPLTYTGLSIGRNEFEVRATDGAGDLSGGAIWRWTVVQGGGAPGVPFTISGNAGGLLYPGGGAQPIAVTLSNPNVAPISVTSLTATLQAASLPSGCGTASFEITQSDISGTQDVQVPPVGSVTLPSQGATTPFIQMVDTGTNQDACHGATVTLDYTGSAH
jgi:hypothetical protein